MFFLRSMVVLFLVVFLQVQLVVAAEKRVALVIGNSAYAHSSKLANPANDACCANSLARNLARSMGTRSASVGRKSPFTSALVKHIPEQGHSFTSLMVAVRNEVLRATNGKQVPWDHLALTGNFYFDPALAAGTIPKVINASGMWEGMKQLELELEQKTDPRETEKMIEISQARTRVGNLTQYNRQDQQEIFRMQRSSFGVDMKTKNRFTREIGSVQVRMVKRMREMKTLRKRIEVLEQELGIAAEPRN
jgi:Caspase domain